MVNLAMNVSFRIQVTDELNARLEQGETEAFTEVEKHIQSALNLKALTTPKVIGSCSVVELMDAGDHNTPWKGDR